MTGGHLVLVLPGRAYGAEGAAIRVPTLAVLQRRGGRVHVVPWPRDSEVEDDWAAATITTVLEEHAPERVTVVAKSLGTMVFAAVHDRIPVPESTEVVWSTPIFGDSSTREGAMRCGRRSFVVAGSADPSHDVDGHRGVVAATGADELVLEGADHSLEVPGDVDSTIAGWRRIAECTLTWAAD